MVAFEIVSREEELASLHALIDETQGMPAALVLEGEAGIGKSTLWRAGVEHARARGLRILSSRPAEAERSLAYVTSGSDTRYLSLRLAAFGPAPEEVDLFLGPRPVARHAACLEAGEDGVGVLADVVV
jgi:hypothetical protein